jgi:NADPH-dependent curcumin reductase CurA
VAVNCRPDCLLCTRVSFSRGFFLFPVQGLRDIGKLKPGEKLVISGAAGSVGSIACQLGKAAGAKVYAIAGSTEKCQWLEKELGVDKAFNYKSPKFYKEFKDVGYLDVYFDNVGGDILDFMLTRLNKNARVILCGTYSRSPRCVM